MQFALTLTGIFMLVEVVGGIISGSLALLADAGHMLTDTMALGLAAFAFRVSSRPADSKRSYGYQRFQIIAAFVNGLSLLFIVGWILFEAVMRMIEPPEVIGGTMLIVASAGLVVNILVFVILHGGDQDNLNIRGAALHVLGDLLGSVAAIIAAIGHYADRLDADRSDFLSACRHADSQECVATGSPQRAYTAGRRAGMAGPR